MWRLTTKLRHVIPIHVQKRTVFVRAVKHRGKTDGIEKQQLAQLKNTLKQLQDYNAALKVKIKEKDDLKAQRKAAEAENINIDKHIDDKDINLLADGLENSNTENVQGIGLFTKRAELPSKIIDRIGNNVQVLVTQDQNWNALVNALYNSEKQLQGLERKDVNDLLRKIPNNKRKDVVPVIYEMMDDAGIVPDKLTYDLIISGYAHEGNTIVVDSFINELKSKGYQLDDYTYGHLIKSLFKESNFERIVQEVKQMQKDNIPLSMKTQTTVLQACIKINDLKQAFDVFDMMKFQGTDNLPDLRVYNAMMLAAAKNYDINKVFDLYKEMTARPISPLQPDIETYYTLIYACSKDERYYYEAWKYVLEIQRQRIPITRKLFNILMYLCGNSGELPFARALFRQLCNDPASYPDSFTLNCLFKAYKNFKPGVLSPVLNTALGNEISTGFLFTDAGSGVFHKKFTPPMLNTIIDSPRVALMESRAVFQFFKTEHFYMINRHVVMNYLEVPKQHGSLAEFRKRYYDETYSTVKDDMDHELNNVVDEDSGSNSVAESGNSDEEIKLPRDEFIYLLGLKACIGSAPSPQALTFATEIWTERGFWRRTEAYKNLSHDYRKKSDFLFARGMIELLTKCDEVQDAIELLSSVKKLFNWKPKHVENLLNRLKQLEDWKNYGLVKNLVTSERRQRGEMMKEYSAVQGERDYRSYTKKMKNRH